VIRFKIEVGGYLNTYLNNYINAGIISIKNTCGERSRTMAVKNVGEKYHCNVCGNEVEVTNVGGGTLVCCGQEMELIVVVEEK
jgi:desulfoferrodoxin-like iron-binding protein